MSAGSVLIGAVIVTGAAMVVAAVAGGTDPFLERAGRRALVTVVVSVSGVAAVVALLAGVSLAVTS